jgi:hypothetical protein
VRKNAEAATLGAASDVEAMLRGVRDFVNDHLV